MYIQSATRLVSLLALAAFAAAATAEDSADAGRESFEQHCAVCHLSSGAGVPSAFPPLGPRIGRWAQTEPGRDYLISVISNGLFGMITVDGVQFVGAMPPLKQLGDDEIAAILNYVATEFGGAESTPFAASTVAATRERLAAQQSMTLRPTD